ncbi:Rhodanese-like domain-containing protein [Talaromyces proteolyticus]|uniref:Rhodanese-like domain-containing protein n=1 Tax=Talaromyces proteolyticus TaxID=1131652 RepID=A0AAD4KEQ1_9EURO|nr:Rhodanese-like domain-containing protein [Talaromyces proteolyticus]KAH8689083.1 Rhodanese-like domain-containing protein [Talaromyces proteolyticus]
MSLTSPDQNPFNYILVSPAELHTALSGPPSSRRIVPVAAGRLNALTSYRDSHIPSSVFFNMDKVRDTTSPYPQMLPTPNHFASCMSLLGIQPDDIVVIYDTPDIGLYFSPRVAWMFNYFGHTDVHVLNNFPRYIDQGFPVSKGDLSTISNSPNPSSIGNTNYSTASTINFEELRDSLATNKDQQKFQILDARIPRLFFGTGIDSNTSRPLGHMPGAINIPLASILTSDKAILPTVQLNQVFEEAGVKEDLPVVLTCNSGVTAAALGLALQICGYNMDKRLYDGSWSEWADRATTDGLIVHGS